MREGCGGSLSIRVRVRARARARVGVRVACKHLRDTPTIRAVFA